MSFDGACGVCSASLARRRKLRMPAEPDPPLTMCTAFATARSQGLLVAGKHCGVQICSVLQLASWHQLAST